MHPHTAMCRNNLALRLRDMGGRHSEAEQLLREALVIFEAEPGKAPEIAMSLHNLAFILRERGRHSEAEPLYKRALKIREAVLGPENPSTAMTLNNLASLYRAQGRYSEAEPLYKRALKIREAVFGPEHLHTVVSLINLALLYEDHHQHTNAEPLFQRALPLIREAEPQYQRALKIREAMLGTEHPDAIQALNDLASLYRVQGRYVEADELLTLRPRQHRRTSSGEWYETAVLNFT
jgi:tetratricopeptide (TPR) repeat protein